MPFSNFAYQIQDNVKQLVQNPSINYGNGNA